MYSGVLGFCLLLAASSCALAQTNALPGVEFVDKETKSPLLDRQIPQAFLDLAPVIPSSTKKLSDYLEAFGVEQSKPTIDALKRLNTRVLQGDNVLANHVFYLPYAR